MKCKKKGQIALEFLFTNIFVLLFVIVISSIILFYYQQSVEKKLQLEVQAVGEKIKKEIDIASISHVGYRRVFEIPGTIYGKNYTIESYGEFGLIKIIIEDKEYAYRTTKFNGSLRKGNNVIVKDENGIRIN